MNVESLEVTKEQAILALQEYKAHRVKFDAIDKEIARLYRAIAAGKTIISVKEAIVKGGLDELGRPKLAIMRADQKEVRCSAWSSATVTFTNEHRSSAADWHFEIPWPNRALKYSNTLRAILPRIPPKHRPADDLSKYHILWEADWADIPRDPFLLKKIGTDAYVVLAAWDLTDVEMFVMKAYRDKKRRNG